jgi:hypothetical protein
MTEELKTGEGLVDGVALSYQELFQAIPGKYVVMDLDYNMIAATDEFLEMTMVERDAIML